MKRIAVFAVVGLSLSLVACKSAIEKAADEVCACKDTDCVKKVGDKYKDKMPDMKLGDAEKSLSEKDKEALGKMIKCSLDLATK
jgi:hypothetical protein